MKTRTILASLVFLLYAIIIILICVSSANSQTPMPRDMVEVGAGKIFSISEPLMENEDNDCILEGYTIGVTNTPLHIVLNEVQNLLYERGCNMVVAHVYTIAMDSRVNLPLKTYSIPKLLNTLLKNTGYTWKIIKGNICILKK